MAGEKNLFATYAQPELELVRGKGVRLFDADGNDYIDLTSGIAVNALGHAHPALVDALKSQAENLWHTANIFNITGQQKLAEKLCNNSFADKVFFTNSGTEALEASFKTARRYHWANGDPERINILTFEGAFHGRSLGGIAAGGQEKYLEGFGPKVEGFISLPFGDHEALETAIDEKTAAILVEPIQGEGGVRAVPHQCLRGLRALCDEHGILLIYDEVQTGIGRTGHFFAYQGASQSAGKTGEEAQPDILAAAKGLGGGFPVGACLATEAAAAPMEMGTHGTTFGGNPLAMAVGNAVLDIILEEGFLETVRQKSGIFSQILAEMVDSFPDLFDEIRGAGMLRGLKAKIPNIEIIAALREERLLCVGAGDNVVRLLPPLIISETELSETRSRMIAGLERLSTRLAKTG